MGPLKQNITGSRAKGKCPSCKEEMRTAISESVDLSNLSLVRAEERRCDFDNLYEKKSSQNLLFPGLTVTVFKTKSS